MTRRHNILLLLLPLCCILLSSPAWARLDPHLKFREISISGSEKQMKDSLRSRDFHWGMDGLIDGYIGYVAGQKMTIQILTTPESKEVYALVAYGPKIRKWEPLKQSYLEIKELLRQKYGRPLSHSERFHKLVLGRSAKRRAVYQGKCDYRASFKAVGGVITVYIDSDRRVCIEFQDALGAQANEREILSEL